MEYGIIRLACGTPVKVDLADCAALSEYVWKVRHPSHATSTYARARVGGKQVDMHRFLLGPLSRSVQVDHIDRDGLNNCRSNLRICEGSDNYLNRGKFRTINGKPPASRFKGVQKSGRIKRPWRAVIKLHGNRQTIGLFETEEQAARAYDAAATALHGAFAATNETLNLY